MKMKELLSNLEDAGFNVTERMIRNYISIGLLDEPEHPSPNQSNYTTNDLSIIMAIENNKRSGLSLADIKPKIDSIKECIYSDSIREVHSVNAGSEYWLSRTTLFKEWMNIANKDYFKFYNTNELIKEVGCSEDILNLAFELNLLNRKEKYDYAEKHMLRSLNVFMTTAMGFLSDQYNRDPEEAEEQLIFGKDEAIKRLKKVIEIADQIVEFTVRDFDEWQHTHLLQSILFIRARNKSVQLEDKRGMCWSWDNIDMYGLDEYKSLGPYWGQYFKAVDEAGIEKEEFFKNKYENEHINEHIINEDLIGKLIIRILKSIDYMIFRPVGYANK